MSAVVQRFQVSPHVAVIQLHQAGLISKETKEELRDHTTRRLASRFGWKASHDHARKIAALPRASERLVADAYKAYSQGLVTLSTVAFAEQVSPEEVADSMQTAPSSVSQNLTDQHDIVADLDDFFANEKNLLHKFVGVNKLHVSAAVSREVCRKLEKTRFSAAPEHGHHSLLMDTRTCLTTTWITSSNTSNYSRAQILNPGWNGEEPGRIRRNRSLPRPRSLTPRPDSSTL